MPSDCPYDPNVSERIDVTARADWKQWNILQYFYEMDVRGMRCSHMVMINTTREIQ